MPLVTLFGTFFFPPREFFFILVAFLTCRSCTDFFLTIDFFSPFWILWKSKLRRQPSFSRWLDKCSFVVPSGSFFFFFLTYLINKSGINFGGGWDNYLNWFFFPRSSSIVPMPFIGKPSLPRSAVPPLAYISSYVWQVCIEVVNPVLSVSLSRLRSASRSLSYWCESWEWDCQEAWRKRRGPGR